MDQLIFKDKRIDTQLTAIALKGDKGEQGITGASGASAYEVWRLAQPDPSAVNINDFLNYLQMGPVGPQGPQGQEGKSAYQSWLDMGGVGTEVDFLATLEGQDGKSAYQVAVLNGFTGTEQQWLASLIGADGAQGLKGDKGDKGDTGLTGQDGVGIQSATINGLGELVITLTNSNQINLGDITGENGQDGVGVQSATINGLGELVLFLTNGFQINVGKVVGETGVSCIILGSVNTVAELPSTANIGDAYIVQADGDLYVYNGSAFTSVGQIVGPAGVGIQSTNINTSGELVITYTDGVIVNLGVVKGQDGSFYIEQSISTATDKVPSSYAVNNALSLKSDVGHTHEMYQINNLVMTLSGKADVGHTHQIYEIPNLQNSLDNKADINHNHDLQYANITHNHDSVYYTQTQINNLINGYLPLAGGNLTGHTSMPSLSVGSSTAPGTLKGYFFKGNSGRVFTPSEDTVVVIENSTSTKLNIVSGDNNNGQVSFGDSDTEDAGFIKYDHSQGRMVLGTNSTERFEINSNGNLKSTATYSTTSTEAPNLFVDSDGSIKRSTAVIGGGGTVAVSPVGLTGNITSGGVWGNKNGWVVPVPYSETVAPIGFAMPTTTTFGGTAFSSAREESFLVSANPMFKDPYYSTRQSANSTYYMASAGVRWAYTGTMLRNMTTSNSQYRTVNFFRIIGGRYYTTTNPSTLMFLGLGDNGVVNLQAFSSNASFTTLEQFITQQTSYNNIGVIASETRANLQLLVSCNGTHTYYDLGSSFPKVRADKTELLDVQIKMIAPTVYISGNIQVQVQAIITNLYDGATTTLNITATNLFTASGVPQYPCCATSTQNADRSIGTSVVWTLFGGLYYEGYVEKLF